MAKAMQDGKKWLGILVVAWMAGSAAGADVAVAARITPTEITVGDPVRYEITVTHPSTARVELPAVRGNTGSLEVLEYAVRSDSTSDGRRSVTYALTLAAYEVGTDTLPPQRVEVRVPPDTTAQILYTPPTFLTVKAVAPSDAKDIAEIHDEATLPRSWPWGLPLLLAALYGIYRAFRGWKKRRALKPAPIPQTPVVVITVAEAALARLEQLRREGYVAAGQSRVFAFGLSEILREYLAARFGIDALEATTAELLERTERLTFTATHGDWLRHYCDELDTVKFADAVLAVEDESRLLDETAAFIRSTAEVRLTPASQTDNQTEQ